MLVYVMFVYFFFKNPPIELSFFTQIAENVAVLDIKKNPSAIVKIITTNGCIDSFR